jgi:septum formation protein
MKFILASKSIRRKEILNKINLDFEIFNSQLMEKNIINNYKKPSSYCKKLAIMKSKLVAKKFPDYYVIGADTIVVFNNKILNKPLNKKEAVNHLNLLSDNKHTVYTGVSLINISQNINKSFIEKTIVYFNKLNSNEINHYITKFKPYDKAGGYAIQEYSNVFVKKINGCFYNVVGFPLPKFYKLLKSELKLIT